MSSFNKKKRKSQSKYSELVVSVVNCPNCNYDIPVRGERDQGYVLRAHFSVCTKRTTSGSSQSQKHK